MGFSTQIRNPDFAAFGKYWAWFLICGIAIAALGIFAISASVMTTLITIILLGILLLICGVVVILDALSFWRGKGSAFYLHIIMGIMYLIAGYFLIKNPIAGSISITLLLGIFYLILGIFRLAYSASLKLFNWGWSFFNGLITLLLGILILANWPASSLFILGLFVGIDLLFCGLAYMMIGLTARKFASA